MPAGSSATVMASAVTPGSATCTWSALSASTMSTGGSQETTSWVKNWRCRRCARSSIDRASPNIQLEKSRLLTAVRWRRYSGVQVALKPRFLRALSLAVGRTPRRHRHWLLVLVPVIDAATRHVVGRNLEPYAVAGEDADAVLAHAAAGIREHAGAVLERDAEIRVRQHLEHGAVHLQHFFLGHDKSLSCARRARLFGTGDDYCRRETAAAIIPVRGATSGRRRPGGGRQSPPGRRGNRPTAA